METAKLDYSAFHGKLEVIAQVDAITDPWGEAELANGYIFNEMQYSLLDNLEIHSYVDYGDFYSAEYDFNEQNALQVITNTRFVGLRPLMAFDVIYKHLVDDKTVYLGEVSKSYANDFYLANTLESQIYPSLTVTGQFDIDSTSGGIIKANVRQTVGPLIFNAGGKFELTDGLGEASVNSSIGLNLFDHVILALSGTYGGFIYNGHTYYHLIQVGTGLKIQL